MNTDTDTDAYIDTNNDTDTEIDTIINTGTDIDTDTDTDTDTGTDSVTDTDTGTDSGTQTQAQAWRRTRTLNPPPTKIVLMLYTTVSCYVILGIRSDSKVCRKKSTKGEKKIYIIETCGLYLQI
jgi:hypothetical protein